MDTHIYSGNDDHVILSQVVNYYYETLKNLPKALLYLKNRGIDTSKVVEHFKLGFCDRTLGNLIPEKNRKEGAALRGQLQRIRILKPNGHELFRGSIVVPVFENGVVKQIYGRKLCDRLRSGTPLHTFLSGQESGFFNYEVLQTCEEVIFCSSIIDTLTFWCAGFKNVTCLYSEHPDYSDEILHIVKSSSVKRVLIAFENSNECNTQASDLSEKLNTLGIDSYRLEFPSDMDANAYALSHKPANESLGGLIRKANWIGKGSISLEQNIQRDISDKENEVKLEQSKEPQQEAIQYVPASVLPEPPDDIDVEINDNEIIFHFDERCYRVRGLKNNICFDQLKVNILVSKGHAIHVDVINLYKDSSRNNFIKQASIELAEKDDTIKHDLSRLLLKLEVLQQENIYEVLKPKTIEHELSKKDKTLALNLLQSPDLISRILNDFEQCGIVGETSNILISYLATLSRKQNDPLAVIIQSTSAAGKVH